MAKLYKVCKKGSKEPLTQTCSSGPSWRGRWAISERQTYVFDEYMYAIAWEAFVNWQGLFGRYKDNVLLFDNKVVAEAFRNPKPKDDYDIYRLRLYNTAPQDLKDYVIKELKAGKSFVSVYI